MKYSYNTASVNGGVPSPESHAAADSASGLPGSEPQIKGGNPVDDLQARLCLSGSRLLNALSEKELIRESGEAFEEARQSVYGLEHFSYNIGFTGEQSCGKSAVINSLIRYPLMPTCNLTTTAIAVRLIYSEKIRVLIIDDVTREKVVDIDCENLPEQTFGELLRYVCLAMPILVIDNIAYFTDKNIYDSGDRLTVSDIKLDRKDPKQTALLALILFAVYIGQDDTELTAEKQNIIDFREKLLRKMGMPKETRSYSALIQWDSDVLKSGLMLTDLPGLGATAATHEQITQRIIVESDSMVFIEDETVKNVATNALKAMLSSAKLKNVVNKSDRVISLLNKVDRLDGSAQITTSQNKMIDLLGSVGISKTFGDIVLYQAIYGEYNFDVSFKRTLFYLNNHSEKQIERVTRKYGITVEEARQNEIDDLSDELREKYEKSGVDELSRFFRTDCVERGKYNKSVAVVQTLRSLAIKELAPLINRAKAHVIFGNVADGVIKNVTNLLSEASKNVIGSTINSLQSDIEIINSDTTPVIAVLLAGISPKYIKAFKRALTSYRDRLSEIADGFTLTFGGIGSKAQINLAGSHNETVLDNFKAEIEKLPVDLLEVNDEYEKILSYIGKQIDNIYKKSISDLESLKDRLTAEVEKTILNATVHTDMSAGLVTLLQGMGVNLITFVDQQIDSTTQDMNTQKDLVSAAGNEVIAAIVDQNITMTIGITESVKGEMKGCIAGGKLFTNRDYIMIDGPEGLKSKIEGLSLTEEEENNIDINIRETGAKIIQNKLTTWLSKASSIVLKYSELESKIDALMKSILADLSGKTEDSAAGYAEITRKIRLWGEILRDYRAQVQPYYDASFGYMLDTDPESLSLCENVLKNVPVCESP